MAAVATDFVKLLAETQLLDDAHLEELDQVAPAYPNATDLASELVRRGWLTSYQLDRLNTGAADELLIGPYALLEEVGQGGMGKVYKARHRRLDRVVALKVINPAALSAEAVQRFQREAKAIARLKHPNIVLLYDAGEYEGMHFLALEFIQGVDLDRLLQQRGPLPITLACDCVRQAALGLQHAHERGLVHRDIKPSNLVLTRGASSTWPVTRRLPARGAAPAKDPAREALLKILDLGLARLYPIGAAPPGGAKLSVEGFVVGTPDYLAPEQALDSHGVDTRADIYSLGCTFYELLSGATPFAAAATGTQKLLCHLQEQPPPVAKLRPDVPAGVVAVLRKMMAKQPHERFQTPGQVADALAAFARAQPPDRQADKPAPPMHTPPSRADRGCEAANIPHVRHPSAAVPSGLYVDEPKEMAEHDGPVRCVTFSPDGRHALSGGDDQAVFLWDVQGARKVRQFHGHAEGVRCVAFGPDGRTAVSGGSDRALFLWDVETGQPLARFKGPTAEVTTAAFSPDGKLLLTGGKDQALHLWDVTARRYLRPLCGVVRGRHYDAVEGVAFAPDGGRAVSVSLDKTLRLWNIQSGRELHCFEGHTDQLYCVAFSPDGYHVATAGRDRTVRLWGVVSGTEVRQFEGHTRSVHGLAFSRGGRHLLSGGDTTVRLWDVATGRQLYTGKANTDKVLCVAMPPDGSHLLAGGDDGVVRLWGRAL